MPKITAGIVSYRVLSAVFLCPFFKTNFERGVVYGKIACERESDNKEGNEGHNKHSEEQFK